MLKHCQQCQPMLENRFEITEILRPKNLKSIKFKLLSFYLLCNVHCTLCLISNFDRNSHLCQNNTTETGKAQVSYMHCFSHVEPRLSKMHSNTLKRAAGRRTQTATDTLPEFKACHFAPDEPINFQRTTLIIRNTSNYCVCRTDHAGVHRTLDQRGHRTALGPGFWHQASTLHYHGR